MGKIKTSKLDNGMVGLEIYYGGLDAPFGGIEASKADRYIEPNCFTNASNFLLAGGELCVCSLFAAPMPSNGLTYPYSVPPAGTSDPVKLLGVGKLPCEGLVKNWALYVGTAVDTNNLWHYRLILWQVEAGTITSTESYDFLLPAQIVYSPKKNAQATVTFAYNKNLVAWQTTPAYAILPGPATPATMDGNFYDFFTAFASVGGTPTGGTPYSTSLDFGPPYTLFTASPVVPTPATAAAAVAAYINAAIGLPFTAAVSIGDPAQIILTAATPGGGYASVDGAAGNALTVSIPSIIEEFGYYPLGGGSFIIEASPAYGGLNPSPFGSPSFTITVSPFSGGADAGEILYSALPIDELTYETVGDNLYFGGWPAGYMLNFNNSTKQFNILTSYQGERVIKKFADHLIGVGLINSADQFETEGWLWFNWSAPSNFAQWNDLDSSGNVTGAGGEQLADVSDSLTGLIVSNSVAFILRAEGLSYATALQGSSIPFDINHVSLARDAQGCASTSLWTQFDQLGFYVGTSNIFMLSQGPQAVGNKVVGALFPALATVSAAIFADSAYGPVNVEALTIFINNLPITYFTVNIAGMLYVYSPSDDTWMKLDFSSVYPASTPPPGPVTYTWSLIKALSLPIDSTIGYDGSYRAKGGFIYAQSHVPGVGHNVNWNLPFLAQVLPKLPNSFFSTLNAYVHFSPEEIEFGKDVVIDAIYVYLAGIPGTQIDFAVSGVPFNSLTLGVGASPDTLVEYQVYKSDGQAMTVKAPQLQITVPNQADSYVPPAPYPAYSRPHLRIAKVAMFGSYDPNQRPV